MSKTTTKLAIAFAFKELLLEKPLDKITVNDITEKCEMNRQTFYYHFHDILELTEWICEEDAERALKENRTYDTWQEGFLSIFEMIKKDKAFIINIYRNVPKDYLYRYLYRVTYQLLYGVIEETAEGMIVREEDKVFIANFYKYGFVGLVVEWIEDGMKVKVDMRFRGRLITRQDVGKKIMDSFTEDCDLAKVYKFSRKLIGKNIKPEKQKKEAKVDARLSDR